MRFPLRYISRERAPTIAALSGLALADVEEQLARLQSWARQHDVEPTGPPFLRVFGRLSFYVHLPIAEPVEPDSGTGIELDWVPDSPAVVAENVPFDDLRVVVRQMSYELDATSGLAGPAEFHAHEGGFLRGAVFLPVRELPASRLAHVSIPDAARA